MQDYVTQMSYWPNPCPLQNCVHRRIAPFILQRYKNCSENIHLKSTLEVSTVAYQSIQKRLCVISVFEFFPISCLPIRKGVLQPMWYMVVGRKITEQRFSREKLNASDNNISTLNISWNKTDEKHNQSTINLYTCFDLSSTSSILIIFRSSMWNGSDMVPLQVDLLWSHSVLSVWPKKDLS